MGARLLQLEAGRPIAAVELSPRPVAIGRDPACDVVVEHARVSRRHVLVEWSNGRGVLQDLGSPNGTTLNGVRVEGAVELRAGDTFAVAGEVAFRVESTDRPVWVRALFAFLLIGLGVAAGLAYQKRELLYWRLAPRFEPELAQAKELAAAGVAAAEAGDVSTAQKSIQRGFWLLEHHGYLDDVKRRETFTVGLARLGRLLGTERDLHALLDDASSRADAGRDDAIPLRGSRPLCRLDQVAPSELRACLEAHVRQYARALRQTDDQIPAWFVDEVGETLRKERDGIENALVRGRPHFPMMEAALRERRMPPLLHYLAGAESRYQNHARSPKAAAGMWQFIPDTGRRYGLVVSAKLDERTDPRKATEAAAEYLRDLALEFGGDSLLLAMAGYNRGEHGVRASLRKLEDPFADRSYWTLCEKKLLPAETRAYVGRIFAQAVGGEGGVPSKEALERAGF